jgi:hypothetical protein
MAASYRIDTARGIVFSEVYGHATGGDVLSLQKHLLEDPDFRSSYKHLVDFRRVDRVEPSMAALRQLAAGHILEKDSQQAYVVGSELASALAHVFRALTARHYGNLEVFRDVGRAREWLGCQED